MFGERSCHLEQLLQRYDSWPPGGQDAQIEGLASRYINTRNELDFAGLLQDSAVGRVALVSSFGTDSAALVHLALAASPRLDVIFLDTLKHFPETYAYVETLRAALNIENLHIVRPSQIMLNEEDRSGTLWSRNPDMCCTLRKTFPLQDALADFDCWITGRKRSQGGARASLPYLERDGQHLKINPLIMWSAQQVEDYFVEMRLPRHPLMSAGYKSIGCETCTRPVNPGEDPRAGRWSGTDKVECGIHLGPDGTFARSGRNS